MQKMKFSYITPRPVHNVQDKKTRGIQKKISTKLLASILKKSCFSSMNRGLAHIQNGWFKKGTRTRVKIKLGRHNFYLYSAVNPENGESSSLLAPNVNTDCMNVFLEQMSQYLGTRKAFLVMDCASWHKSKNLKVPKNIEIIYLPPYSPDCREALVIYKTEHFAQ